MKAKTVSIKAIVYACVGIAFVFISAGVLLTGGVDWTNPPAGHFVSPLASNITWGPTKNIRAFFPAQANLQWLGSVPGYTDSVGGAGTTFIHPGASTVQSGSGTCRGCHQTNLDAGTFATNLVNSPKGITGKDPYKDLAIEAAFDSNYLYVKVSYQTQFSRPGITHDTYRFDGSAWTNVTKKKTSSQNLNSQLGANEFWSYEDRLGIQLTPKTIGDSIKAFGNTGMTFTQAGCFVACHSSMVQMPKAPTTAAVQADPWLGTAGLNQTEVLHYLLRTRGVNSFADVDSAGNWQTTVSGYNAAQQQADMNSSKFIDLIQFRGARSGPMYGTSNDIIMEHRNSGIANTNQGDNNWFDQNPATAQPANWDSLWYDVATHEWKNPQGTAINVSSYRWMYDSLITGFHALPAISVNAASLEFEYDWTIKYPLITRGPDRNATPLDISEIIAGDMLPRRVLRKKTGIRGAVDAFSKWDSTSKTWTITIRRPLNKTGKCDHGSFGTYCSDHDIRLADLKSSGQGITIGFAVFDWYSSNRYHYVTFAHSLSANLASDIVAYDNTTTGIAWIDGFNTTSLEQNTPNPFTGTTQIRYLLLKAEKVRLTIYDISGRVVQTLVNEQKSPGTHTVTWDAQHLKPGVYFYSLQAGSFRETKHAVLIK